MSSSTTPYQKPTVVGIFGGTYSGKDMLRLELRTWLACSEQASDKYDLFEGHELTLNQFDPSLARSLAEKDDNFRDYTRAGQNYFRAEALRSVESTCASSGITGIICSESVVCKDDRAEGEVLWVDQSYAYRWYSHLFYLEVAPKDLYRAHATSPFHAQLNEVTEADLARQQGNEIRRLRAICEYHGVAFVRLRSPKPYNDPLMTHPRQLEAQVRYLLAHIAEMPTRKDLQNVLDALMDLPVVAADEAL